MSASRTISILIFASLLITACTAAVPPEGGNSPTPVAEIEGEEESPEEESAAPSAAASACQDPFEGSSPQFPTRYWEKTNFCKHSVDYDEIFSGGPPPDGIPAIDEPEFISPEEADQWLEDVEPVISFQVGNDARAYPLQIMTWHEIVNDTVGELPVVVTFCPLCNTALVFERPEVQGQRLTFGTSGMLRKSDLVMYDRQTESWWQQFTGEAIVGDLTGTQLEFLPAVITSWEDFQKTFPDGKVLSRDTGYNRSYGRNPYPGYDDVNNTPFAFAEEPANGEIRPMERVVGVILEEGDAASYLLSRLMEEKVVNDRLGGSPITIFWKAGTASALDSSQIPLGKDVGTSAVFLAEVEDQILTFSANEEGGFVDEETGSTWDIFGQAVDGPLEGSELTQIPHYSTFWFAWSAFEKADPPQ